MSMASRRLARRTDSHLCARIWASVAVIACLEGCGIGPRTVNLNDRDVVPLLTAAKAFHREEFGFTPIPATGEVGLELTGGVIDRLVFGERTYDAMLHFGGKTPRTIAFRRKGDSYVWVGEQESFYGPKSYSSVDGTFQEEITLNYDTVPISGFRLNALDVSYHGEDPRLEWPKKLTLADVRPVLKEWGY
jgi:hypothetical protein